MHRTKVHRTDSNCFVFTRQAHTVSDAILPLYKVDDHTDPMIEAMCTKSDQRHVVTGVVDVLRSA